MFENTTKQLFRTPIKILLFTLLISLAAAVFSIGYGLYTKNIHELDSIDSQFVTMGTFEQVPEDFEIVTAEYYITSDGFYITSDILPEGGSFEFEQPIYGDTITLEQLSDLPYKIPIENRPTYLAQITRQRDDTKLFYSRTVTRSGIFQFTPDSNFTLSDGGEVTIRRDPMYGNPYGPRGMITPEGFPSYMYWGGFSDCPNMTFETGKEYISFVNENCYALPVERYIASSPYESSTETLINSPLEVTDSFDESAEYKILQELAGNMTLLDGHPFAVVPTNSLKLLMPFYQKGTQLLYGDYITDEQFEKGEKVCMMTQATADEYALQPGDKLEVSFMAAMYSQQPSFAVEAARYLTTLFEKPIEFFEKSTYTIVGIVHSSTGTNLIPDVYALPEYGIIVPAKSFDGSKATIVNTGLLTANNCSFIIENNSIDQFRREAEKLDIGAYKLSYYDMGYGNVKKGLDEIISFAAALFIAGAVGTLLVVTLFLYLQIMRKTRETAIQISLGFGKKRTAVQLIGGVMLVITLGTVIGTAAGSYLSEGISQNAYSQVESDTISSDYSENRVESADTDYEFEAGTETADMAASGAIIIAAGLLLSIIFTAISLKKEPMLLLSKGGGDI